MANETDLNLANLSDAYEVPEETVSIFEDKFPEYSEFEHLADPDLDFPNLTKEYNRLQSIIEEAEEQKGHLNEIIKASMFATKFPTRVKSVRVENLRVTYSEQMRSKFDKEKMKRILVEQYNVPAHTVIRAMEEATEKNYITTVSVSNMLKSRKARK